MIIDISPDPRSVLATLRGRDISLLPRAAPSAHLPEPWAYPFEAEWLGVPVCAAIEGQRTSTAEFPPIAV
jgi:hypothetical protein